jgi:diketogulonate reductase-like aldo/keto reductase
LSSDLDLFLIHYPGEGEATQAWQGLTMAKVQGLCHHVGVSNFEVKHLELLLAETDTYPEVNQIEFHPYLYSKSLMNLVHYCKSNGILVEGYCPLAWGRKIPAPLPNILENATVKSVAKKHSASASQVILKWCMQHGVRPIFGGLDPNHIAINAGPFDSHLSPEDMEQIDALGEAQIRLSLYWGWDPPSATMR